MKRISLSLGMAALLALSWCHGAAGGETNLAPNPSFEQGEGAKPDGWASWVWARGKVKTTSVCTWDDEVARTGDRSLRVQGFSAGHVGVWDNKHGGALIPVKPRTLYAVSVWVRTHTIPDEGKVNRVSIGFLDEAGEAIPDGTVIHDPGLTGENDWTEVSFKVRTPEGATDARIDLLFGGVGSAWFDDIAVTEAVTITPMDKVSVDLTRPLNTCYRTDTAPTLDGKLDDACWQKALAMEPFIKVAGNALPNEGTRAFVCYDDENLYIGIEALESLLDPVLQRVHEVTAEIAERDGPVYTEEAVEVFLQPDTREETYYQVAVNMIGTVFDARCAGGEIDKSWNAPIRTAAQTGTTSWIVEIAIPLASMGGAPERYTQWGFNICRSEKAQSEQSCWSPTLKGFHVPGRFGLLRFAQSPVVAVSSVAMPKVAEGAAILAAKVTNLTDKPTLATVNLLARYGDGPLLSWPATAELEPGATELVRTEGTLIRSNQAFTLEARGDRADKTLCFRTDRVPLLPDTEYEVSALVKTEDLVPGNRPLALSISSYSAEDGAIRNYETVVPVPAGTSDWQRISGTWRSPANADSMLLWFVRWGNSGVTGTVLVDDVFMAVKGSQANIVPNGALDVNQYNEFKPWKVVLPRAESYPRTDMVTVVAQVAAGGGQVLSSSGALTSRLEPTVTAIGSGLVLKASRAETKNMYVYRDLYVAAGTYLSLPLVLRSSMLDELDGCTVAIEAPAFMRLIDPMPNGAIAGMTMIEGEDGGRRRYQVAYQKKHISAASVEYETTKINYLIMVCDRMPQGDGPFEISIQATAGDKKELPRQYPLHVLPPLQAKRPTNSLIKNWACSSFYRPLNRMNEQMRTAVHDTWGQAGYNASGAIATEAVNDRLDMIVRGHLPSVPGGGNFPGGSEFLDEHPEAGAIAFDGTKRGECFCPTFFLSEANTHMTDIEKYLTEHAEHYEIVDWDLEVPVLRENSICVCERCMAELKKRDDVPNDAELTPESLRTTWKDQYVDFRCRQNAEMAARYRAFIKKANPDNIFTVYSGYQGDTDWRYGVDWTYYREPCDLVWAGYGRPVKGIEATHEAIGDMPFICGELAWFGTYPYDCANCYTIFLRRLTDGGAGIMTYFNWIVDARFYAGVSDAASVAADFNQFFGWDWTGEGQGRTLKARWKRDDSLASLDGEQGHGDLAVLLAGDEQLVVVFNETGAPVTRALECLRWEADTVAVEYFTKQVFDNPAISLDIPALRARVLHLTARGGERTVGAPTILGPTDKLLAGGTRPVIGWQGTGSHPGAQRFAVEVSQDQSFPEGATMTAENLTRTSWTPGADLQPGKPCFVRVRAVDVVTGDAGPASKVHSFTVPAFYQVRAYPTAFSPNGDGIMDTVTIFGDATGDIEWTVTIANADGDAVRELTGKGTEVSAEWDGKDQDGAVVPEGTYTWSIAGPGGKPEATGKVQVNMRVGVVNPTAKLFDGFVLSVPQGSAALENDYAVTTTGTYSLRIRTGENKAKTYYSNYGGGGVGSVRIPVTPGTTVRFSAKVKTDLQEGDAGVSLAFFTVAGRWSFLPGKVPYGEKSEKVAGTTDWTEVELVQEVPPDADSAVPFLRMSDAVGTVWFDEFKLEVVDE